MTNTPSINTSELILSLIKADLRSSRLIMLINKIGILAEGYELDLDTTVLKLMKFEDEDRDDELYKLYILTLDSLCQKEEVSADFQRELDNYAIELYTELLTERKVRVRLKAKSLEFEL